MMTPKSYTILQRAVEEGVVRGWARAHKHTNKPERGDIESQVIDCVMLEISEVFSFPDPNAEA